MNTTTAKSLLAFIKESPTAFQAVETMKQRFEKEGFQELLEKDSWKLVPGGKYYVTRNHSALIAFVIPKTNAGKFHIMASHSDSPGLKIKENPDMKVENAYVKLNVEKYGGMLDATWFDRPLSVAGRLILEKEGTLEEKGLVIDRDLLVIPSLAIHMNREANSGYAYNAQKDLLPLFSCEGKENGFLQYLAKEAGVKESEILGHDLFLYNRTPGTIWGAKEEFISSPRLDDLQCVYASMEGFLKGKHQESIGVHCVLDNEEVGSTTKQGAASTFLADTLVRIKLGLTGSYEEYLKALPESFMVSADNAQGLHPNYIEKADPVNRPILNKGIVIKYHANQKYCTDGVSSAMFKNICQRADVPWQIYTNRSDMAGGSTLGNISNTKVAMNTVDIGLPQLAMHSSYETAGVQDTEDLIKAAAVLFQ